MISILFHSLKNLHTWALLFPEIKKKSSQAMGVLNFFWDSDHVDIGAKVLIYLAIPVNSLLWGNQTWALTKVLTKK